MGRGGGGGAEGKEHGGWWDTWERGTKVSFASLSPRRPLTKVLLTEGARKSDEGEETGST